MKNFQVSLNVQLGNVHLGTLDISLTMGAGGLMNRWGDHSILTPYFGGITQFQVPFMRDHKINLMGDHYFRIFRPFHTDKKVNLKQPQPKAV